MAKLNLKLPDVSALMRRVPPPIIGLDISPSGVKMTEISGDPERGLKVDRFAIEPLAKGVVVDGNVENVEAVAAAVRKVLMSTKSKTKQVALALPSSAVITKRIQLPADIRETDLEVQVETEAAQYIPFPIDEVNLDFQIVGPNLANEGEIDVMLAAARKEKVEDRIAVAEQAGLKPVVLDVENFASRIAIDHVVQHLPRGGVDQLVAVFDIGSMATTLHVVLNGDVVFEREQSLGGQLLTQDIVRAYGITPEDAEIKKRRGGLPGNFEKDLLAPYIEMAASELARMLQFFFTSSPYSRVDHVFLAGGVSVTPGLADALSAKTQVQVRVLNPFHGMDLDDDIDEERFRLDAPALLVACGLALRRFDA